MNKLILTFVLAAMVLLQAGCGGSLSAEEQFRAGKMYQMGNGVEKDYTKAAELYLEAANQGHIEAQYTLGVMYHYGYGVGKSETESLRFIKMAAAQGDQDSQKVLALIADENK